MPLQALASASMLFCGRVTHDTWLGLAVNAVSLHGDSHGTVVHDTEGDQGHAVAGHHHDGGHDQLKQLADSCSACSDCCCPTALPSSEAPSAGLIHTFVLAIVFPDPRIPDATPDRLERPPRSILA